MRFSRIASTVLCIATTIVLIGQATAQIGLGVSVSAAIQAPITVDEANGSPKILENQLSPGYNVGLHVMIDLDRSPATSWLSVDGEYGFFISRWSVSIPATSVNNTAVPQFEDFIHPGGISTSIRQWSVHYGRNIQKLHGLSIQPYVGLGITETVLASLVSVLPRYTDTIRYGLVEVNYGGSPRVAPALRLGPHFTWSGAGRNAWGFGILASLSPVQYIRGGYVVFPGTNAEMRGVFHGTMSYVGVQIFYRFGVGAVAEEN